MQNAALFLTTFASLPPAVLKVFGSQPRHVFGGLWSTLSTTVEILLRTYMEEDQCLGTTAGVYQQEERTLLNILSSVGSLRTGRLHFWSVSPPRSRWVLKCARRALLRQLSRPAAVLVTGIPGRRGEGGLWRQNGSTNRWRWSRHDDKEINRPKTRRYLRRPPRGTGRHLDRGTGGS